MEELKKSGGLQMLVKKVVDPSELEPFSLALSGVLASIETIRRGLLLVGTESTESQPTRKLRFECQLLNCW